MKQPELGKRLKEARILKKMTQSEVVGTFITRNMLSQIESGKAMPSVETLQYLAEVLGIPLQTLISTQTLLPESPSQDGLSLLISAKEALKDRNYRTVLTYRDRFPSSLEDEFHALLAQACCGLADELLQRNDAIQAASLAGEAMDLSQRGLYANELLHSRALLLFNQAAAQMSTKTVSQDPY